MVAGTAYYLATHKTQLGPPGVRVVPEAMFAFDDAAPTNAPTVAGSNSAFLPPHILDYRSQLASLSRTVVRTLPPDTTFGRRLYYRDNKDISIDCQVVLMGADRTSIH